MTDQSPSWLTVIKEHKKCPRCNQGHLDTRVKRGRAIKTLLFWLDVKRYSCNACGRKVYLINK